MTLLLKTIVNVLIEIINLLKKSQKANKENNTIFVDSRFRDVLEHIVDQATRSNDLAERQSKTILVQQTILKSQQEHLTMMMTRMERVEDLQLQMGEILDRDLLSLLDQPLLFKNDIIKKLGIAESTYRNYVAEGNLEPMRLGKIEYYFARDLVKQLLKTKKRK